MADGEKIGNSRIVLSKEFTEDIDRALKSGNRKRFEDLTKGIQLIKEMSLEELRTHSAKIYKDYDKDFISLVNEFKSRKIDGFNFLEDSSLYSSVGGLGEAFLDIEKAELNLDGIRCFYDRKQKKALEFQKIIKETGPVYLGSFGYNHSFFTILRNESKNNRYVVYSESASLFRG